MKKEGFVYFMSNAHNTVLYIGVTSNLACRVAEHKGKVNLGFNEKHNCDKLVYMESYPSISDAIKREKQLKNWKRAWKDTLINAENPERKDMSAFLGVDEVYVQEVKEYHKGIAGQARNDPQANNNTSKD
jgi:putative endonuclease